MSFLFSHALFLPHCNLCQFDESSRCHFISVSTLTPFSPHSLLKPLISHPQNTPHDFVPILGKSGPVSNDKFKEFRFGTQCKILEVHFPKHLQMHQFKKYNSVCERQTFLTFLDAKKLSNILELPHTLSCYSFHPGPRSILLFSLKMLAMLPGICV